MSFCRALLLFILALFLYVALFVIHFIANNAVVPKVAVKDTIESGKGSSLALLDTSSFLTDVPYDDKHPRTKLDFWKAKGEEPRPLVVFVLGTGWIGGEKEQSWSKIKFFLKKGISCAAVNYRRLGKESSKLPEPVYDVARAVQFLRYHASAWNIDKHRVILIGGSFGGTISMFLNNYDDYADPSSEDPVAHESTRPTGVLTIDSATSIDPKQLEPWFGKKALEWPLIYKAVGEDTVANMMKHYDDHAWLYTRFSPFNHVRKNNPPLFMSYTHSDLTRPCTHVRNCSYHAFYGLVMKQKCDEVGQVCYFHINGASETDHDEGFLFVTDILRSRENTSQ